MKITFGWLHARVSLVGCLAFAGIVLRVVEYLNNRPFYIDELALRDGIVNVPVFQFGTTLPREQVAPPLFLIAERVAARILGESSFALRLLPMISGIAAIVFLAMIAKRWIGGIGAVCAVAIFAITFENIYYSSELKPYSTDQVFTLLALGLSDRLKSDRLGPPDVWPAALIGVVATWASFPAIFVLAGVAMVLTTRFALRGDRRNAIVCAGLGLLWALSFALCYAISRRMLSGSPFLATWWNFSFLPLPPRTWTDAVNVFWVMSNLFVNPLGLNGPWGPKPGAFLGLAITLCGVVFSGKTQRERIVLLLLPFAFAASASALRAYPFHGRLLLFAGPMLALLIGYGIAALGRFAKPLAIVASILVLFGPAFDMLYHHAIMPFTHTVFDTHGDLRPDLLDELERPTIKPNDMPR